MMQNDFSPYDIYCATLFLSVINLGLVIAVLIFEVIHYLQNLY